MYVESLSGCHRPIEYCREYGCATQLIEALPANRKDFPTNGMSQVTKCYLSSSQSIDLRNWKVGKYYRRREMTAVPRYGGKVLHQ